MKLRPKQIEISDYLANRIPIKKVMYLNGEVRTGKTLIALETAKKLKANNVLFITKIKAFSSIKSDYNALNYTYNLTIINKESLHQIESNDFDFIIIDEAHQYAAFPKAGKFQKLIKQRFSKIPMLLMSGTMSPESFSQIYHQFQLSDYSPFKEYKSFYKWANDYVNVKQKHLGYAVVNDYTDANEKKIRGMIRHYVVSVTQKDIGFDTNVNENVIEIEMKPITYQIISKLKKDLVVKGKTGVEIVADTGAKLMQKVHQLSSGSIKIDDKQTLYLDYSKIDYIINNFKDYKIAIFYKYVAQLEMLKERLQDKLTTDLNEFNTTDKWIALQFVSGREGVNLSKADALVMLEIDYSATTYFQARDRLSTKDRKENNVFWIFGKNTIDFDIYKRVKNKAHYTTSNFIKDNGIKIQKKDSKRVRR